MSSGDEPDRGESSSVGLPLDEEDSEWEKTNPSRMGVFTIDDDEVTSSTPLTIRNPKVKKRCLSWFCAFFILAIIDMVVAIAIALSEYFHVDTGPAPLTYVAAGVVMATGLVCTSISFSVLIKRGQCCCRCRRCRCCLKKGEPIQLNVMETDYTAYSVSKE